MKTYEQAQAAAESAELVWIPDRYQDPFLKAWAELTGETIPPIPDRRFSVSAYGRTFRTGRGRNMNLMAAESIKRNPERRVVALTGSEMDTNYTEAMRGKARPLGSVVVGEQMGKVTLFVPGSYDQEQLRERLDDPERDTVGVVTALSYLVGSVARTKGMNMAPEIVVDGSVEGVAEQFNMPGVDLVVTGTTLDLGGFIRVETLEPSYPVLIMP